MPPAVGRGLNLSDSAVPLQPDDATSEGTLP